MILLIPLVAADVSNEDFSIDVALDGTTFTIDLSYSPRSLTWYASVFLTSDTTPVPIQLGAPLVAQWPILAGCTHPSRPLGELVIDADFDPAQADLGAFAQLLYFDAVEMGRVTAATA